jgi:hypothetical protein
MRRLIVGFCTFINTLVAATIRTGNVLALVLAALIYFQIQVDIVTMENKVRSSLDTIACTGKMQTYLGRAQAFASDCSEIACIEAYRAATLDEELEAWMIDYDRLEDKYKQQIVINRSMRVYIERLHRVLRENQLKIPPQQPRPIGG